MTDAASAPRIASKATISVARAVTSRTLIRLPLPHPGIAVIGCDPRMKDGRETSPEVGLGDASYIASAVGIEAKGSNAARLAAAGIETFHILGHEEGVEDSFLGRLDRRDEERRDEIVGELHDF